MRAVPFARPRVLWLGGTLLILAALVLGLVTLAIGPVLANLSEASQDALLVRHLNELAAEKPVYEQELAVARDRLANQNMLYQAASPELEGAQLQTTAQTLVAQAGGQLGSAAIDPAQSAHGLQLLAVSLAFTLPAAQLPALLASIDAQLPYLQVIALDARQGDGGGAPLNIQLDLGAFGAAP